MTHGNWWQEWTEEMIVNLLGLLLILLNFLREFFVIFIYDDFLTTFSSMDYILTLQGQAGLNS